MLGKRGVTLNSVTTHHGELEASSACVNSPWQVKCLPWQVKCLPWRVAQQQHYLLRILASFSH